MAVLVVMIIMMMVIVVMVMMMAVPMLVIVVMIALRLPAVARLDARLAFSASASSAHQSTSSSLIRNSSPPVACT